MNDCYTNETSSQPAPKDVIEQIETTYSKMKELTESIYKSFSGMPVRVDETLSGEQYYIAVSPELHLELVRRSVTAGGKQD